MKYYKKTRFLIVFVGREAPFPLERSRRLSRGDRGIPLLRSSGVICNTLLHTL
jgi:hypothetical protein